MCHLLLVVSLLHLATLGTFGEPCGDLGQNLALTHTQPQHPPTCVSKNITCTTVKLPLTWTYMVVHIQILTMAATREDPPREPRDPRDPERPTPAPRAIQLTVKYPSFNCLTGRGTPMSSSSHLNKELRYSWRAHMRITKNQTRLQQSLDGEVTRVTRYMHHLTGKP